MSFGLPSVKPKPSIPQRDRISQTIYGVPDVLTSGFGATTVKLEPSHPLEMSEQKFSENQMQMNMSMLRNRQGLHAPLRLNMELHAAKQVGHLPFLPSANFMSDVLTGKDEEIGFEDFLNTAEFREKMVQPHAYLEKHLNLL